MSVRGHHHLAAHRSSKLDDRLDQVTFVLFDDVVLDRRVGQCDQLLRKGERPLAEASSRHDHIRQTNEAASQEPDRTYSQQKADGAGQRQCRLIDVQDGDGAGHGLSENEHDDEVHADHNRHQRLWQKPVRQDRHQRRLGQLGHHNQQPQCVADGIVGAGQKGFETGGSLGLVVQEAVGPRRAGSCKRLLGGHGDNRKKQESDSGDRRDHIKRAERRGGGLCLRGDEEEDGSRYHNSIGPGWSNP